MVEQHQRWLPQARRATFEVYRRQAISTWIEAHGSSMRPLIEPGTWMLVEFGAAPAGLGEIVLFPLGDMVVAHRVVAERPGATPLVAKGDAEPYADRPLERLAVLGVVRALQRDRDGPSTTIGCAGRSARTIARLSWWSGCGAALARRATTLLSDPLRRATLNALPPLARVAALALFAPFGWAAQIQAMRSQRVERR